MDWQEASRRLWGDDWIAPLAELAGVNRRTIERWKAGDGAPPPTITATVTLLARRSGSDARITGTILRRMAGGETEADIRAEINAMKRTLERIDTAYGSLVMMRRGDWPPEGDSQAEKG